MYRWPTKVYEGEWKDGQRHGQGTLTSQTGEVYTGQWKGCLCDGLGVCLYPAHASADP